MMTDQWNPNYGNRGTIAVQGLPSTYAFFNATPFKLNIIDAKGPQGFSPNPGWKNLINPGDPPLTQFTGWYYKFEVYLHSGDTNPIGSFDMNIVNVTDPKAYNYWNVNNSVCYNPQGLGTNFRLQYVGQIGTTDELSLQALVCDCSTDLVDCATNLPILPNSWKSGMGNDLKLPVYTEKASFWCIDYGNEPGRWTWNDEEVSQRFGNFYGTGNYGSRAYPAQIGPAFENYTPGVGCATGGCWQIDMKIKNNKPGQYIDTRNGVCATFYLAQRNSSTDSPLTPDILGYSNYGDGSCQPKAGSVPAQQESPSTMEIDIMETNWTPTGPQYNFPKCPNPISPNVSLPWCVANTPSSDSQSLGNWDQVGGCLTDYCTFGAFIDTRTTPTETCYIYAFTPAGDLWYCSPGIPGNGAGALTANRKPFVPYIGTWGDATKPSNDDFNTLYKNFVYRDCASFPLGATPQNNPSLFGGGLLQPAFQRRRACNC